jgi:predicted permease
VGGLIGVLVARAIVNVLLALAPPSLPRQTDIVMDVRALAFAAAATLLSGLLFGLLPALKTASSDPGSALREAGRGAGAGARHHGLRGLVIAQLALAMVLVSGGGLLVRSLGLLMAVDPGFDAHGVYTFRVSPPTSRYAEMSQVHAFYNALLAETAALPGVVSVGATWGLPFSRDYASGRITVEGRPLPRGSEANMVINPVRGDYFRTLDLSLVSGRLLNDVDSENASPVVLINETAAQRFWPGEDVVGKRFRRGRADETDLPWITVVGVVEDAKRSGLDSEVAPEMYWNHVQAGDWARDMTLVVRAQGDPLSLANPLRAIVSRIDPQLAVTDGMLLEDRIAATFAEPRFRTVLLTAIAALALLLAVVGTYGVMAFVNAQRRQEIGVRMALGANTQSVLWTVMRDGLRLIAIAAALGLLGAALSARAIATLLFGVTPFDPLAHATAVALLVGTALLACWLPAVRASRVDPLDTLRNT